MADEATNRAAFEIQAGYCDAMATPVTARLCRTPAHVPTRATRTGTRALDRAGEPVADALVLRLVGGRHALHRRGVEGVFDDAALPDAIARHDAALLPWLDGPRQTDEAQRSAGGR